MQPVEIATDVHWTGVNDRTTHLFEGIWPIQREGVSYNAYLIDGAEPVLIDPVRASKAQEFLEKLGSLTDVGRLRYLVLNHMEQDHTGSVEMLRRLAPDVTIVGTEKTRDMLESFYGITDNVQVVKSGDMLSAGDTTLQFFATPFVHWPETMMTYEPGRKILFSCDAFGSFGALQGTLFDDQCPRIDWYESEGLRYFANIVARFSRMVLKAIDGLSDVEVELVAPSHGLVWRDDPARMVELYRRWSQYAEGPAEPGVTIIYGSMYGFTERMMNAVAQGVADAGVPLETFDAGRVHPSYILASLWRRDGVIVGAPTYEGELFPPVAHAMDLAAMKRPLNRKMAAFGSYGWSGGAGRELAEVAEALSWDVLETLEFEGRPDASDLDGGRTLGRRVAEAVGGG